MLKKDENFYEMCKSCGKLIPFQHFNCQRKMVEGHKKIIERLIERLNREVVQLRKIQKVVDEQAEDEGLWHEASYASEAYIQKELRRLHAIIEEDTI
jgi:hypothetical protein